MDMCERCGSSRITWFTPEKRGRQVGIFMCLDCAKLNLRLPRRELQLAPVRVRSQKA